MSREDQNTAGASAGVELTAREAEVLSLILRGLGNKEIAVELGLAEVSVKQYASVLLRKFEVPNRAALASAGSRLELTGSANLNPSWIRQLFRDSHLLVAVLAGPDLRFVAANAAVTRLLGGPLVGRTLREAIPEYAQAGLIESVERVYATGESLVRHAPPVPLDRRGDAAGYCDFILQPLHDDNGRVNGVVYFGIDVTEQVCGGGV